MTTTLPVAASPAIAPVRAGKNAVALDEFGIILVTSLGHTVCHMGELAFSGALLSVKGEFSLSPEQAATLGALGYLLMGLGALPVGVCVDRLGTVRVLAAYFVAMAVAALSVIVAPGLAALFVALTLLGLAASLYHPVALAMISLGCKARGRAMGINGVAGSLGVALGPFLGLTAAGLGQWRLAYAVVAGLSLVGLATLWWILRRSPQSTSAQVPFDYRDEPAPAAAPSRPAMPSPADASHQALPRDESTWRRYLPLVFLMAAMMLGGFNYRLLVTSLPTYLAGNQAQVGQLKNSAAIVFLALAVGGVGQYVSGHLADRRGSQRTYLVLIASLVLMALLLAFSGGGMWAVPIACGLAYCLFGQQPVENSLLAEHTSTARRSTSYGTKFALTFGVGSVGAPVVGFLWQQTGGLAAVYVVLAISAVAMASCVFMFGRLQPRAAG